MPDEYISRKAAAKLLGYTFGVDVVRKLHEVPAADVAPVVRCENCEYVRPAISVHTGKRVGIWCALHDILNVSPDDYCSRGKKKGATE